MATTKRSPVSIALVVLVLLAAGFVWLSGFYTDYLWFNQLGYATVFTTGITAGATAFSVGFVLSAGVIFASVWLAGRKRPIYASSISSPLDAYRQLLERSRRFWLVVLPLVSGFIGGAYAASKWQTAALFFNHTYTGIKDAQFGLDTGFYLFDLDFYTVLTSFLTVLTLFALLAAAGMHLMYGSLSITGRKFVLTKPARVQIAVIAAVFIALQGVALWLDQYSTMTSDSGLFTGACLLYTSPSPRDYAASRMPSSA